MANHRDPAPEWLNSSYMEGVFRNHFKEPSLKVQQIEVSAGSQEGDNYCCQIFRIKVKYQIGGNSKTLSVIGKYMLATKMVENFGEFNVFVQEALFFSTFLPGLIKINKNSNVSRNFAPLCYYADTVNKIILMEDLVESGFTMQPKKQFLDLTTSLLAVKALANLHGAGYKFLEENPKLKLQIKDSIFSGKENFTVDSWMRNGTQNLIDHVDSYGFPEEWCRKLKMLQGTLQRDHLKVCDLAEGKLNVLLHGDPWLNNMMYRIKNDICQEVILLDFQIINYNSFANDLNYFVFSSVDCNVIVEQLDIILEAYYKELKAVAPEIPNLTLERIHQEFNERLFYGYTMTIMFRSLITSEVPPDLEKILEGHVQEQGFNNNPIFVENLRTLLPYFEKAGVF